MFHPIRVPRQVRRAQHAPRKVRTLSEMARACTGDLALAHISARWPAVSPRPETKSHPVNGLPDLQSSRIRRFSAHTCASLRTLAPEAGGTPFATVAIRRQTRRHTALPRTHVGPPA
jgi:hypothetical protein